MINTAGQKILEPIYGCYCNSTGGCSICNPAKKMNEKEFLTRLVNIDDESDDDESDDEDLDDDDSFSEEEDL